MEIINVSDCNKIKGDPISLHFAGRTCQLGYRKNIIL